VARRIHDAIISDARPEDRDFVERAIDDIYAAIAAVDWPAGSGRLTVHPESGKKRGEGNGVKPLKDGFLGHLASRGWQTADRKNPKLVDAVLRDGHRWFGVEWETGNISSSHRAVSRVMLAVMEAETEKHGVCVGGCLVVPTANLAQYLTDRVGNWEELAQYHDLWCAMSESERWPGGHFSLHAFEHDDESFDVPRMGKATDGRAFS
jgi:hypothetical protein